MRPCWPEKPGRQAYPVYWARCPSASYGPASHTRTAHPSALHVCRTAGKDPLFREYHQPGKEKRMVVILPEGAYRDWFTAPVDECGDFLVPIPSDKLVATPVP
ncbi:hypothetical protein G6F24_016480 [Rhizopus arrhizus]|nr:hypothetical protein G6F24_016480 [Rhizopus arrhizus]